MEFLDRNIYIYIVTEKLHLSVAVKVSAYCCLNHHVIGITEKSFSMPCRAFSRLTNDICEIEHFLS